MVHVHTYAAGWLMCLTSTRWSACCLSELRDSRQEADLDQVALLAHVAMGQIGYDEFGQLSRG